MSKPLIQTDDIGTTREMTEEEHAHYSEVYANAITPNTADSPSS
jgi:hypothetical protein